MMCDTAGRLENGYQAAVVQMVSGDDFQANMIAAHRLVRQAADEGAQLILLPENFALFSADRYLALAQEEAETNIVTSKIREWCREYGVWICAGTIPLLSRETGEAVDGDRVRASSLMFDDRGELVVRYDKMHLFDVTVGDKQGCYQESAWMEPGSKPAVVETPFGVIGLSVCYDLRFPELYRLMSEQGAQLFLAPSAFTQATGHAHWDLLLRARAVENLAYVLGANQGGQHNKNRETYGGSMLVDPWGKVLAQLDKGEGVVIADVNLEQQRKLREEMPVLEHRRL